MQVYQIQVPANNVYANRLLMTKEHLVVWQTLKGIFYREKTPWQISLCLLSVCTRVQTGIVGCALYLT